ncbi:MAG TPA: SRPBCC family protein [Candidatus Atribacteria bacterium]|nr:SRPBCC family protein [Candidatus Atribacteria bacterium]
MAKVSSSLVINGSVEEVYNKAKDVEKLATFLPSIKEVKVLNQEGSVVDSFWKGEFQGREIKWKERDFWDEENKECRFSLIEGDFKQYEGVWRFKEEGEDKTRVELEIEYDLGIPLVGALISKFLKKVMEENAQAMLKALQEVVER